MRHTTDLDGLGMMARSATGSSILSLLLLVLGDFHTQKISYCYWKSSRRVASVLAGDNDLDLLVAREDQYRAQATLLARGFKLFPCVPNRDHPSIMSYLGFDQPTGRLIHVHLYVRLITGEPLSKNYHLPWEAQLLARAIMHPTLPIRILDPASEAILLVIRACLEHRRLDPSTLRSWQMMKQKFAFDRSELAACVDRAALLNWATNLLTAELAELVVAAIYGQQALDQPRLRRGVHRQLAACRSYNAIEARARGAWRAILWLIGNWNKRLFHAPRPWHRRAPGGGCVVAVVGVDGSGKTTVVAAIKSWLRAEIDVIPIYFGTGAGRPSLWLRPLKSMVPLITHLIKTKSTSTSHPNISARPPGWLYRTLLMIWATAVAVEKRRKLVAARRGANRGLIILADRYPQNEIIGFNDGPLLNRLPRVPRWLSRFEAAAYRLARRLPPDLVIKLQVMPETAARREPEMDLALIRDRIRAVQRLTFGAGRVVCVNAEQPLPEVIRAVQHELWHLL